LQIAVPGSSRMPATLTARLSLTSLVLMCLPCIQATGANAAHCRVKRAIYTSCTRRTFPWRGLGPNAVDAPDEMVSLIRGCIVGLGVVRRVRQGCRAGSQISPAALLRGWTRPPYRGIRSRHQVGPRAGLNRTATLLHRISGLFVAD